MKKLVNDPRQVVREMLEGLCDLHPGLMLLQAEDVVVRAGLPPPPERPVAILSGGGAGHEPAHAGYVGPGLLAGGGSPARTTTSSACSSARPGWRSQRPSSISRTTRCGSLTSFFMDGSLPGRFPEL